MLPRIWSISRLALLSLVLAGAVSCAASLQSASGSSGSADIPGLAVRGFVTPKGKQARPLQPTDDIAEEDSVELQIESDRPAYIYIAKGLSGGQPRLIYPEAAQAQIQPQKPIRISLKAGANLLMDPFDRSVELFVIGSLSPLEPSLCPLFPLRCPKDPSGSRGGDEDDKKSDKKDDGASSDGQSQRTTRPPDDRGKTQPITVELPALRKLAIVPLIIRKR